MAMFDNLTSCDNIVYSPVMCFHPHNKYDGNCTKP